MISDIKKFKMIKLIEMIRSKKSLNVVPYDD